MCNMHRHRISSLLILFNSSSELLINVFAILFKLQNPEGLQLLSRVIPTAGPFQWAPTSWFWYEQGNYGAHATKQSKIRQNCAWLTVYTAYRPRYKQIKESFKWVPSLNINIILPQQCSRKNTKYDTEVHSKHTVGFFFSPNTNKKHIACLWG